MNPYISVIIPCYNVTKYLDDCFYSLVNQTIGFEHLQLIFVNDASTDDTLSMLMSYEKQYPENIIVVDLTENMRQGGARNVGLTYATGNYISFVDSDDWVDTTLYEKAYNAAISADADILKFYHTIAKPIEEGFEYTRCDNLCESFIDSSQLSTTSTNRQSMIYEIDDINKRKSFLMDEVMDYGCWNKLYKRQLVNQVQSHFAEHLIYEEPLFVYPLLYYAQTFVILEDYLYFYRFNSSGTMVTDSKQSDRILNHPKVQLMLLCDMVDRGLLENYYDEIQYFFIHSFFFETMYFASKRHLHFSKDTFAWLCKTVTDTFDDYASNPYIIADKSGKLIKFLEPLRLDYDETAINTYMDNFKNIW